MEEYGVTDKGFVIKRLDTIMNEVHAELTEGFGVDTRLLRPSFLDTLVTTFCDRIAELWEVAQDSYYAKYPSTAIGMNLDNAVQYGGIRRKADERSSYSLHCTGKDGTAVRANTYVATDTNPEIRLFNPEEFVIERASFNSVGVKVAALQDSVYTITINGENYSYTNSGGGTEDILNGLKNAVTDDSYELSVSEEVLTIKDTVKTRVNELILSDNLTTDTVTVIATFMTEDYGRIYLPDGVVKKIINNISGFDFVTNILEPVYGRLEETDIELRQSYIAKSALRSNTMIDSIVSELMNNVVGVESASGYENDTDVTNERGLPPHSIEIVVDGGNDEEIAKAILMRKAGGIQTYGSVVVNVPTNYGYDVPTKFNRPDYLYAWLKITLHGNSAELPSNYKQLVIDSVVEDCSGMVAGTSLLIQSLHEGIYDTVSGVTYIDITTAYESDKGTTPEEGDYKAANIIVTQRQRVLVDEARIEVTFSADP